MELPEIFKFYEDYKGDLCFLRMRDQWTAPRGKAGTLKEMIHPTHQLVLDSGEKFPSKPWLLLK